MSKKQSNSQGEYKIAPLPIDSPSNAALPIPPQQGSLSPLTHQINPVSQSAPSVGGTQLRNNQVAPLPLSSAVVSSSSGFQVESRVEQGAWRKASPTSQQKPTIYNNRAARPSWEANQVMEKQKMRNDQGGGVEDPRGQRPEPTHHSTHQPAPRPTHPILSVQPQTNNPSEEDEVQVMALDETEDEVPQDDSCCVRFSNNIWGDKPSSTKRSQPRRFSSQPNLTTKMSETLFTKTASAQPSYRAPPPTQRVKSDIPKSKPQPSAVTSTPERVVLVDSRGKVTHQSYFNRIISKETAKEQQQQQKAQSQTVSAKSNQPEPQEEEIVLLADNTASAGTTPIPTSPRKQTQPPINRTSFLNSIRKLNVDDTVDEHRVSVGSLPDFSPKPPGITLKKCCCYSWSSIGLALIVVMVLGITGVLWSEDSTDSFDLPLVFPPPFPPPPSPMSPPKVPWQWQFQPPSPPPSPPSPPPRNPPPPLSPLSPMPDLDFMPSDPTTLPCHPPFFEEYVPVPWGRRAEGGGSFGEVWNPMNVSRNSSWLGEWKVLREDSARKAAIVEATRHAWQGYKWFAFGEDELRPLTKTGVNNFGGFGLTIIDSLDTLWLMGLTEEFEEATRWVEEELDFDKNVIVSVFEITIRVLGGLLSAFDLTGRQVFKLKAEELGWRLLRAFETDSGLPYHRLNLRSGQGSFIFRPATGGRTIRSASLAEVGTLQLEFNALSRVTGNPIYQVKAARAFEVLTRGVSPVMQGGLFPIFLEVQDLIWIAQQDVSFGSHGDSFYEYLLKVWIQRRGSSEVDFLLSLWIESMDDMTNVLLQPSLNINFIAERRFFQILRQMDHLACYVPGMMVLGESLLSSTSTTSAAKQSYALTAKQVLQTCFLMYNSTATGLAPETTIFPSSGSTPLNTNPSPDNYQRPETVESLFVRYRRTGDEDMREQAWAIFQAFEKHSRVDSGGYTGLKNVNQDPPPKDDYMQSFFLAETLKYLYLIFSDSNVLPLDVWVFNTEAHPLQIHCNI